MTTPVFPSALPGVSSLAWQAEPQARISDNEVGNKDYRNFTAVPAAVADVEWRFLDTDFAVFKEFWKTELKRGHKWFTLVLPSAAGHARHVVRFITSHSSKRDGYGYRTVTAQLFVRERKLRPDIVYTYVTSTPYAVVVNESMRGAFTLLSGVLGTNFGFANDDMDSAMTVLSGLLEDVLVTHSQQPQEDRVTSGFVVYGGALNDILVRHTQPQEDDVTSAFTLFAGSLEALLVTNEMQDESMDSVFTILSGILA